MKKINIITLGCSKNTVDSEHLAAQLTAMDYKIVFDVISLSGVSSGSSVSSPPAKPRA